MGNIIIFIIVTLLLILLVFAYSAFKISKMESNREELEEWIKGKK